MGLVATRRELGIKSASGSSSPPTPSSFATCFRAVAKAAMSYFRSRLLFLALRNILIGGPFILAVTL